MLSTAARSNLVMSSMALRFFGILQWELKPSTEILCDREQDDNYDCICSY